MSFFSPLSTECHVDLTFLRSISFRVLFGKATETNAG